MEKKKGKKLRLVIDLFFVSVSFVMVVGGMFYGAYINSLGFLVMLLGCVLIIYAGMKFGVIIKHNDKEYH